RPSSGHWYFSLKDQKSQIRCAMFRGANQHIRTPPREGDQIRIRGKVTLYENRGDFQIIVEHLEPAGLGPLQQAFEALKIKLQAEGLFDAARKKPMPAIPRHIGVVTSPTGAAIHDILTVLARSEERRVGKERRGREDPDRERKQSKAAYGEQVAVGRAGSYGRLCL